MYHQALISPSRWGLLRRAIGFALVWSLASGAIFIPGVWAATFYVDDSGDNSRTPAEAQNPATPWKTITRAITEPTLASGDDVQVGAGTYDATLGETFPLRLVNGVAIIGDPDNPDSRLVSGPGGTNVFFNNETPLAAGTRVAGLRLTYDTGVTSGKLMEFDVSSVAMAPEISDNVFAGAGFHGIDVEDRGSGLRSFTGLIESNTFVDLEFGVDLEMEFAGTADHSPTLRGNTFTDCDYAISISVTSSFNGTASPVITKNTATGSINDVKIYISLSEGRGPTVAPLINNNTFSGSSGESIFMFVDTMSLSSSSDTGTFSPTILNNTITDSGEEGMWFSFNSLESCNLASNMTIAGNTITNPGDVGIFLEMGSFSDGHSIFVDWTISDNTITFGAAGVYDGIDLDACYNMNNLVGGHLNLTVAGNTITGARHGMDITLNSMDSTKIGLSMTIQGNTITDGTGNGIYILASYQYDFTASHTDIVDNMIDGNVGHGLDLDINDYPSPTSHVQVACNTVVNNGGHGVQQHNDTIAPPPDYGGGDLSSPGLNTLMGNGTVSGYDFYNWDADAVAAHNNWWGTTDTGTIDANIYDFNDDGSKGEVLYSGFLPAAPTVSATASLVDALENDLSPPGPSYGDTIRYTATLEGTGDCGCASALFTVPIPGNGIFIPDSLIASRGILINEAVSTDHPELKVGLGAMEASETVTITWDVIAGGGCSMTSQATLSCYQLGDLLTDDPDVGGGSDPTTVILDHLFCDGFESGDIDIWSNSVP